MFRYIAPTAMGAGNGSTPADAAALSGLNTLITNNPGACIRFRADQGVYNVSSNIVLAAGGVTLESWHPTDPTARAMFDGGRAPFAVGAANGSSIFRLGSAAAGNITMRNINCRNVGNGLVILGAAIAGLHILNVSATNVFRLLDTNTRSLSKSSLRKIDAVGYEKGMVRLDAASNNVLIEDIDGDSAFNDDEPFTSPIALEGTTNNVTIRRVRSRNVVDNAGAGYWNGDGFSQEQDVTDVLYEDCTAENTSDGGFDLKGSATLIRPRAIGNKRNYRFWLGLFTLHQPYSENPVLQGGSADAVHFGFYQLGGRAVVNEPIIVATPGNFAPAFKLDFDDTIVWVNGHDDITLIEGQPLVAFGGGVTTSEVIFNPPLPTIAVDIAWRSGFAGGAVPKTTPIGTAVADLSGSGTSPIEFKMAPGVANAFVLDGSVVRVGSGLAGIAAATTNITIKAHHPRWIVFDQSIETVALS